MNNETQTGKISKDQEAGAFWLRKSKAGASYLSGYVLDENKQKVQLVVFKNSFKKDGDSAPDYRAYFSENKNSSQVAKNEKSETDSSDSQEDDIPF